MSMSEATPATVRTQTSDQPIACLLASRPTATTITRASVASATGAASLVNALASRPALVVMSSTVNRLYGDSIGRALRAADAAEVPTFIIPAGESNKTTQSVLRLLERAYDLGLSRDGLLVGIGGGVVLDIVGFAASQYRRGIDHIKVGTTLVAQVDAAVGLKCGVNVGSAKNLAGAFYPPVSVLTDSQFLTTLRQTDIRSGLAEMVKLAVATDEAYFAVLEDSASTLLDPSQRTSATADGLVDWAISGMVAELNTNPYEGDLRRRVDAGHTISPYIESATDYAVPHGEAVAIDLGVFAVVSNLMGILPDADLSRLLELLKRLGLPLFHPSLMDSDAVSKALDATAAHRGRKLRLPLPERIGSTLFVDERLNVPDDLMWHAILILKESWT